MIRGLSSEDDVVIWVTQRSVEYVRSGPDLGTVWNRGHEFRCLIGPPKVV